MAMGRRLGHFDWPAGWPAGRATGPAAWPAWLANKLVGFVWLAWQADWLASKRATAGFGSALGLIGRSCAWPGFWAGFGLGPTRCWSGWLAWLALWLAAAGRLAGWAGRPGALGSALFGPAKVGSGRLYWP